jgi:PPOX class probable F420-dependent enzyme
VDDKVKSFLEQNGQAVMTTLRLDGTPHMARVLVALVNGKLWSSGTQDRVRTKHLRRDPRCGLFVMGSNRYEWMGLDTEVAILDGPDAAEQNLELYRAAAGEPDDLEEYLAAMVKEKRLIYEFDVKRSYGQF